MLKYTISLYILILLSGPGALAQTSHIQTGLGLWRGVGVHLVHIQVRSTYTLEISTSIDTEFWQDRNPIYLSSGLGAALRPLGMLREIGQADYPYDIYVGVRFGPALIFQKNPTRAEKNRQFGLFLDPFLRYIKPFGERVAFIEIGSQRPSLRLGIWIPFE